MKQSLVFEKEKVFINGELFVKFSIFSGDGS